MQRLKVKFRFPKSGKGAPPAAYHHPEGNSYIERFHRTLKEEEVWVHEYRNFAEAQASITHWIGEYNHRRPHQGIKNRTPHQACLAFAAMQLSEAPHV